MNLNRAKFIVILATLLWGTLGLLSVMPAVFAAIGVHGAPAPVNVKEYAIFGFFWSMATFPVVCFFILLKAWTAIRAGSERKAYIWCLVPLINVVIADVGWFWFL